MPPPSGSVRRTALLAGAALALAACASDPPLPLDMDSRPVPAVSGLRLGGSKAAQAGIDLSKPLGAAEIALLAVENNPEMKAARAERGVAAAQLLQAGLLPNPQFGASYGVLLGGPGTIDAWSAGLAEDIRSLVTLSTQRAGARYQALKVDADLAWQEWQVAGKARLLYIDIVEGEKLKSLLGQIRELFQDRYMHGRAALAEGNLTLATVAPDFAALGDIEKQIDDFERQQQTRRQDLDALLGLAPEAELHLAGAIDVPPIDSGEARRLLSGLPRRRPDLLALQLGYRAEEAKLRGAILARFPALVFGGTRADDTSHIRTIGPQITLDLPIFNRNQGNVAIEQATRQKLHDEFSGRLLAARSEVEAMLARQALLRNRREALEKALAAAEQTARHAETAFRSGSLDERGYVDLAMSRLLRRQEILSIEQLLLEQQAAMATLLGAGMPAFNPPDTLAESLP